MSESGNRLEKLKRYVPFLHRTQEYTSPDESRKINQLINIISNSGDQLLAETLERCEKFCIALHSKYGKEDEIKVGKHHADGHRNQREPSRLDNAQQSRGGGAVYDETPRSPSPEETNRFSRNSIPKAIPNQREDFDLRARQPPVPIIVPLEPSKPEVYRTSSKMDHTPRPLRTEPVVIPTTALHAGMAAESFPKQDQDYRSAYDQSMSNGRLAFEERHVSYNKRGATEMQPAGTSYPKRESRFDRYGDRPTLVVGTGRPYEEPLHPTHPPKVSNHWDSQQSWDQHARRGHSDERDRSFQNRGPPTLTRGSSSRNTRWDTPNSQPSHFSSSGPKSGPVNRPPEAFRDSASGSHHSSSYRNGEPSSVHNPRSDWAGSRHEPTHGSKNWSNRDPSPSVSHHNYERDFKSSRNHRPAETTSRQGGLLSHPNSSGCPVPSASTTPSSSFSQSGPRVPNYPSNSYQQTNPSLTSPPGSRREDPRLANRSKVSGQTSTPLAAPSASSATQLKNVPAPSPSLPVPSGSSSSSRLADPRSDRGLLKKTPSQGGDLRKEPVKPATSNNEPESTGADIIGGSSSRDQDEFVSPLNSLYSGSTKPAQTGRGYGVQSYKIPKKASVDFSNQRGKRTDTSSIVISAESSTNEDDPDRLTIVEDVEPPADADKEKDEVLKEETSIPFDVTEGPDAKKPRTAKPRGRPRTKTTSEKVNAAKNLTPKSSEDTTQSSSLPTADATVTSSDDIIPGNLEQPNPEDEGTENHANIPLVEGSQLIDASCSGQQDLEDTSTKKKGRTRSSLPLEVARLQEDLTDFMKGGVELGTRRCRSKSTQPTQTNVPVEDTQRLSQAKQIATSKRSVKRKSSLASESDPVLSSPVPGSEEGNDNQDDSESTYSSSMEPTQVLESSTESSSVSRGQTCNRGRGRGKGASRGRRPKSAVNSQDHSPEGTSKTRMRKKPQAPTHLSLRGRRSMYEDSEPSEQIKDREAPASGDQYFKCQHPNCSYLGQKIIHHYANEHAGIEIPFAVVPEAEWTAICNQGPANPPPNYKLDADLLSDLSWIPARPNYTSPVTCKLCPYTTSKRSELIEHFMIHALPVNCNFHCTLCGLTESNFFDMLDHIAGHTGEFRYRCNYCNFCVAHRPGIKHHMSSMHTSQDGLNYTTISLVDADQLWIYGFVCRTCRFVQMTEDRLERHKALHEDCDGYRKVNLISLIQDPNTVEPEASADTRTVMLPRENESGVFICRALEGVQSNVDLDEKKLTETLKLQSTSFIKTLAEKLSNPPVADENSQTSRLIVDTTAFSKDEVAGNTTLDQTEVEESTPDDYLKLKSDLELKNDSKPDSESMPTDEMGDSLAETNHESQGNDRESGKSLLAEVWKPNTLLETTISKLVGQLGVTEMETSLEQSIDSEDVEETGEEVIDEEAEDEEQEEEEEEDDDEEDDGEDGDSEDIEEENVADDNNKKFQDGSLAQAFQQDPLQTAPTADKSNDDSVVVLDEVDVDVKPALKEAPTDTSGFLRIESVISLNDDDEDDCLDPVSPVVLFSSVTMAKNELTFPYSPSHDRPQFAIKLKDEATYLKMLDPYRLRNLFKCMAFSCIFSSDSPKDFTQHLQWHSKHFFAPNPSQSISEKKFLPEVNEDPYKGETLSVPDFFLCSYCPFSGRSPAEMTDHTVRTHGQTSFQCSKCFFRAPCRQMIDIHSIVRHQGRPCHSFNCKRIEGPPQKMAPQQLTLAQVPRYRCCVDKCDFTCILRDSYIKHLSACHPGLRHFRCRICSENIVCNNNDYTQYFLHMNTHEMGFLQCAFCLWGSDLPTDALIHLCLHHPSLEGKLFSRSLPSGMKTLLKFWNSGLSKVCFGTHQLTIDHRHTDLFDSVVVIDSELSPEDDVVHVTDTTEMEEMKKLDETVVVPEEEEEEDTKLEERVKDVQETTLEDEQVHEKVMEGAVGRKETEFHGFEENKQTNDKESTDSIVRIPSADEENSLSGSNDGVNQPPNEETGEEESGECQEGLSGTSLYMCGNIGCDETFETASALKEHLAVCDLARDCRLLTCRHCGKNMKQSSNLITHLRSHGVKRFLCGLCNYRAHLTKPVREHMKAVHRVTLFDEVSIGPGPGPASDENILYSLYPKEMIARLKLRSRTPNKKGSAKIFSWKDRESIPPKNILPYRVQCAHCGYSSNIRTNMIRHLSLHECNDAANGTSSEGEEITPRIVIPDQDPVNPVPCLEMPSKGMMFDKMANLAYSSHVKDKPLTKERMGHGHFSGDASDPKSQEPVFVPDHQRYVCGFDGCVHLTSNENMLKYHLQTLHKNAVFTCPHCQNDDEKLSMDSFRNHLKMHGPQLYKCHHCVFYHWHRQDLEYHLTEKHPNRPPWLIQVRDPSDDEVKRMQSTSSSTSDESLHPATPWNCSLCRHVAATAADMLVHIDITHGVKSQFKCALCPVRCNVRSEFDRHFKSKHPNQDIQVLAMFFKVESSETFNQSESPAAMSNSHVSYWKKDANRCRHIRGILLDEGENKTVTDNSSKAKNPAAHPEYGPYGAPSNNQYSCPKCENYRSLNARDLSGHLYRELNYKKFLCSLCNEGSCSRKEALNHVSKLHPNSAAYIRETTSNRDLELWVEKVVKVQTEMLKSAKSNPSNSNKRKSSASSSPATSAPSSPVKSPSKAKKTAATTLSTTITLSAPIRLVSPVASSSTTTSPQKLPVITIDLDSFEDVDLSSNKNNEKETKSLPCLSCQFTADSEQLLEEHVVAIHASVCTNSGKQICLECGFKATAKNSLVGHQKKTKHSKSNVLPSVKLESEPSDSSKRVAVETEDATTPSAKKARTKPLHPFRCKHCNFSSITEHGMNLHWQRLHSPCQLPLEFDCDLPPEVTAAKPESAKIYYRCQLCPVKPGLYDEMREHAKTLHPNSPFRPFRVTSKVRHKPEPSANVSGAQGPEPAAKIAREEVTISLVKEAPASTSPSLVSPSKRQLPKLTPISPSPVASGSSQTVFVVAPAPPSAQPVYTCVCCRAKFVQENQVIRHHATHPNDIPLRYTYLDTSKQDHVVESSSTCQNSLLSPPKPGSPPELAVMEIRFWCPVCTKSFISLSAARQHVMEHKQAWKCGHCSKLFATPTLALQHLKDVHPGLQGTLESIDSPSQIGDNIGITRAQIDVKSLLKDKSSQSSATQSKEPPNKGAVKDAKEKGNTETPPPLRIPKAGVARKSTSANLFLKENIKQEDQSSPRDTSPSNPSNSTR